MFNSLKCPIFYAGLQLLTSLRKSPVWEILDWNWQALSIMGCDPLWWPGEAESTKIKDTNVGQKTDWNPEPMNASVPHRRDLLKSRIEFLNSEAGYNLFKWKAFPVYSRALWSGKLPIKISMAVKMEIQHWTGTVKHSQLAPCIVTKL